MLGQEGREPMTAAEMAEELEWDRRSVDSVIRFTRPSESHPDRPKLLYIAGWKRSTGTRGRWGARYLLGDLPDAPPPRAETHKKRNKRYRAKHRTKLALKDQKRYNKTGVNHWLATLRT